MRPVIRSTKCRLKQFPNHRDNGFTFIEMIAALALMAILAAILGLALVTAVQSYEFGRVNIQLAQKGQAAMARITRELLELTHIYQVEPAIIFERVQEINGIPANTLHGLAYDSDRQMILLYSDLPDDEQGDPLVDLVDHFALDYYEGTTLLSAPFDLSVPTAIEARFGLVRTDEPNRAMVFRTFIHLRNR